MSKMKVSVDLGQISVILARVVGEEVGPTLSKCESV